MSFSLTGCGLTGNEILIYVTYEGVWLHLKSGFVYPERKWKVPYNPKKEYKILQPHGIVNIEI